VQGGKKPRGSFGYSRRKFLAGLGISMAAMSLRPGIISSPWFSFLQRSNGLDEVDLLYPPVDLSYFETPIGHRI
jgi:hypothetical protein